MCWMACLHLCLRASGRKKSMEFFSLTIIDEYWSLEEIFIRQDNAFVSAINNDIKMTGAQI